MNAKNNDENNSIRNNIHEIWSKICFVSTVTFVWNRFLSSEISQFRQLIDEKTVTSVFTGNPKFKQEFFFGSSVIDKSTCWKILEKSMGYPIK